MTEPATRDYRTDEQLFAAINRGDVSAFETLFERHHAWAFAVGFRFTRREADAADVVQDAFAYLLQKAPQLVLTARFRTYFYPILKHAALQIHRRGRREGQLSIDIAASLTAPPETTADVSGLFDCLARLPELQREVLLLRYIDGLTQEEISDALSIPIGTVKSRLHRALQQVRGLF